MQKLQESDLAKLIRADLRAIGAKAPQYSGGENVENMRAYLRRYCEPFLRGLIKEGVISDFKIGISTTFFYYPKLRVIFKNQKYFEVPLSGVYPIKAGLII